VPAALDTIRQEAREAHAAQRWDVAEEQYRRLLAADPQIDDVINLGALLRSQGRYQEGSAFYKQWLTRFGSDRRMLLNACHCWNDNGEAGLSIQQLEAALRQDPSNRALAQELADALLQGGRPDAAVTVLRQLLHQDQANKDIWVRLGLCHARLRQLPEALDAFSKAQQLDPGDPQMLANRITVLKDLGRFTDAQTLIDELTPEQQQQADIANAIAGLWMAQNKLVEASALYQHLATQKPQCAMHWLNWAAALRGLRHTVAPHRLLQRGLQHQPEDLELQQAMAQILAEMAKPAAVQRLLQRWTREDSALKPAHLFSQQFLGIGTAPADSSALAAQARQWEVRCQQTSVGPLWPDLLRVGYLSADLCNHPVGRFLLPVLGNHDRSVVETWAVSCGSHDDWITEHLRQRVDHWLDVRFHSAQQAARLIADLRLDVLVELGGFTGESGLEILCHRPAPVQLSYLGYPAPTYLRCIDGWLGDAVLFEQLNATDQHAHPLLCLEGGYMVFDSGGELPTPQRSSGQRFRFGSFNHARKLSDATISLFCQVLAANPGSELVLKSISFREAAEQQRIRQRFTAAGLAPDRLTLLDWVEGGLHHLQRYSAIDVALDPVPYGGATTTAEALWMGVPVVALAGRGMVGRLAASLLVHGGQGQWLARSEAEYVAIASRLAAAGPRQGAKRLALRQQLQQSPLGDGQRLSRALEQHYQQLRAAVTPG
jgi:predicted O-linked N-acetylglucosamine transferase (SPINDLY family)